MSAPIDESDPASITGFRLDKYEVTVGRFRRFRGALAAGWVPGAGSGRHVHLNGGRGLRDVGATGIAYEIGWSSSYDGELALTPENLQCDSRYATWTATPGPNESRSITCVNWFEAFAFCIWDGGFLPSEAETEFAAAGGDEQREYPWGSTDPGTTNEFALYGCYFPSGAGICNGLSNVAPVGSAPMGIGEWGQLDLAGGAWEWVLDWDGAYVDPCVDCARLSGSGARVIRGGNFSSDTSSLLPANRSDFTPDERASGLGFRCARAP